MANNHTGEDNGGKMEWGVPAGPPPEIRLPFEKKRKRDAGEWIYDHREPICITAVIYLVAAIIFLFSKIIMQPRVENDIVVMDFREQAEEIARLRQELERAQMMNDLLNNGLEQDFGEVHNAVSNENAGELSEETRELVEQSEEVLEAMGRNGAVYQQMLAAISVPVPQENGNVPRDSKISGGVTVSFSLARPLRHAVRMPVPAYKCSGGGRVVVDIEVSRNGDVIAADVNKAMSVDDYCMVSSALATVKRSHFNVDPSAPVRQHGTVTYIFVAQ